MSQYSFNYSDLEPRSPRVPPYPLVAATIYVNGTATENEAAKEFLDVIGAADAPPLSRWLVLMWDTGNAGVDIANASFAWTGTDVVLEGMYIDDAYQALNLDSYLIEIGSGLFGNREVMLPEAVVECR